MKYLPFEGKADLMSKCIKIMRVLETERAIAKEHLGSQNIPFMEFDYGLAIDINSLNGRSVEQVLPDFKMADVLFQQLGVVDK